MMGPKLKTFKPVDYSEILYFGIIAIVYAFINIKFILDDARIKI